MRSPHMYPLEKKPQGPGKAVVVPTTTFAVAALVAAGIDEIVESASTHKDVVVASISVASNSEPEGICPL